MNSLEQSESANRRSPASGCSVNAWLDKELGQIGIYMRQSGHHKNMIAYLKALREEITMTETFLSEDGYSPNDQAHRPRTPGMPSEPGVTD